MKIKFYNPEYEMYEEIDTEELENDSGEDWSKELLIGYIKAACPRAKDLEILK